MKYAKGDIYQGHFKDGDRDGKGLYKFTTGERYDGEWKNSKRNGKGKNTWPSGL